MTHARRPQTRDECKDGPRPCPWVSCRHHLALEITLTGVRLMLPENPAEWADLPTCALDVADAGPHTQTALTALLDGTEYTYSRIRRAESDGLARIARRIPR